ncbi:MAG: DUF3127 domain-containing protein [Bacteroidota bacterium]
MAFDVEGKLYKKFDTNQVTDTFRKREFVMEMEDGAYTQLIKFQLTQNNCEKLDPFNEGDQLKVTFSLRGREYKKDSKVSYFTNLDAWRVEAATQATAETPSAAPEFDSFPTLDDAPTGGSDNTDDLPF